MLTRGFHPDRVRVTFFHPGTDLERSEVSSIREHLHENQALCKVFAHGARTRVESPRVFLNYGC